MGHAHRTPHTATCFCALANSLKGMQAHRALPALRLLLLQGRQIVAEILDPFSHRNFVIVVHGAEDRSPYWHVGRTMRQDTSTKTQHIGDVLVWEFAAVAFGERG